MPPAAQVATTSFTTTHPFNTGMPIWQSSSSSAPSKLHWTFKQCHLGLLLADAAALAGCSLSLACLCGRVNSTAAATMPRCTPVNTNSFVCMSTPHASSHKSCPQSHHTTVLENSRHATDITEPTQHQCYRTGEPITTSNSSTAVHVPAPCPLAPVLLTLPSSSSTSFTLQGPISH
jgi:hypothetical protein